MMAGSLKIIATPIGNVKDISLRAIDHIKRADIIFAEDTRHSLALIRALDIELLPHCRLVSCHAQVERERIGVAISRLLANDSVVLLSDAGCPTISDPGSLMVQGVIEHGLSVEVIPGPSAHSAALMGAGIDTTRFAFLGFLPKKNMARHRLITKAAEAGLALVIYESPLRVLNLLSELHALLGTRRVVVARELTKAFETFHRGELGSDLRPQFLERGECVVVVEAGDLATASISEPELESVIEAELKKGRSVKDVAQHLVDGYGLRRNAAYAAVIGFEKNLGERKTG